MLLFSADSEKIQPVFKLFPFLCVFAVCVSCFGFNAAEQMTTMGTMEEMNGASTRPVGPGGYYNQQRGISGDSKLDTLYATIAEQVNFGKTLPAEDIKTYMAALRIPGTTVSKMPRQSQLSYFLLAAWTFYYTGDMGKAELAAKRVLKMDPENKDGIATYTMLSLMGGSKPEAVAESARSRSRSNSTKSVSLLELDTDQLRNDIIGLSITDMDMQCINSTSISYKASAENLCVVLWRLFGEDSGVESGEPNGAPTAINGSAMIDAMQVPPGPDEMYENFMMSEMPAHGKKRKTISSLEAAMNAYGKIFSLDFEDGNTKFIAINKDDISNKKAVMEKLMKNGWPWAQVMENDPGSNALQFKGIDVTKDKPVMLLISKGKITYAGPATGFLAPMLISKSAGITENQSSVSASTGDEMLSGHESTATVRTENNMGSSGGNISQNKPEIKREVVITTPVELSVSEEVEAQKLLENCKMYIKLGRKLGSYKKAVGFCRETMQRFPNTKYAEEARKLLREVPERHHSKYQITSEELGL